MKKIKSIIIYILVGGFIFSNIFSSYTFAEDNQKQCGACSATPDGMQMYINFQVELLGILQGSETKNKPYSGPKRSGLFGGGYFAIPDAFVKSVTQKIKQNVKRELSSARSLMISSVLLYKLTLSNALSEGLLSINILFRNESFVRDYKILQEIDMSTNDIIRDMAERGMRNDKISPDIYLQIQNLQTTYTQAYGGRYPIFEYFIVSDDVRNRQLLTFIYRLNSLMKGILYNVEQKHLIQGVKQSFFDRHYEEGTKIDMKFNAKFLDYVASGYECAVGGCNYGTKRAARELAKDATETRKRLGTSFSKSKDTIVKSTKELGSVLKNMPRTTAKTRGGGNKNEGLTDKQVELLRTIYGADTKNLTTTQLQSLKLLRGDVKEELADPVVDGWKSAKKGIQSFFSTLNRETSESSSNQVEKNSQSRNVDLTPAQQAEAYLSLSMEQVRDQVLALKIQDQQIGLGSTNQDTVYFVQMGEYIHNVIINEDINGADGLVQLLGMLCEYQCSNKGNKNCFAK